MGDFAPVSTTPNSYTATLKFSIRADPTRIDCRRTNETSTSWPLAVRARDFNVRESASAPARRARSGVTTVILAAVSRRKIAVWLSFSTTGTKYRLLIALNRN